MDLHILVYSLLEVQLKFFEKAIQQLFFSFKYSTIQMDSPTKREMKSATKKAGECKKGKEKSTKLTITILGAIVTDQILTWINNSNGSSYKKRNEISDEEGRRM